MHPAFKVDMRVSLLSERQEDHFMRSDTSRSRWRIVIIAVAVCLPAVAAGQGDPEPAFQIIEASSGLSLHKAMFMLPVTYSDQYRHEKVEAVFQMSAKHRIFGTRFFFAYTQISFWQAYDHFNSAPFRETNYNPEIFYRTKSRTFASGSVGADIGFEHESNGQRPPVSRSWNLLYVSPYYQRANYLIHLKLRYRIPEDEKETPDASVGDDNPDITDYLGHSDLNVYWNLPHSHRVHVMLRGNFATGKGGMIFVYSIPIPKGRGSLFGLRFSHGYGDSLVDYNKSITRVGIGVMFVR